MFTLKSYRFLGVSAFFFWREVAIAASKPAVNGIHEETWITWIRGDAVNTKHEISHTHVDVW